MDLILRRRERNVTSDCELAVVSIEIPAWASVVARGGSAVGKSFSIRAS